MERDIHYRHYDTTIEQMIKSLKEQLNKKPVSQPPNLEGRAAKISPCEPPVASG